MFQLIEKLQNKSERERHAIAFWIATSVTGIIALLWITSMIALHSGTSAVPSTAAVDSSLPSSDDLQNIGTTATSFYEQFKQNIDEVRQGLATPSADSSGEVGVDSEVTP